MFLNSVILILQEILEAALLVSVLLVLSKHHGIKPIWLLPAIIIGITGALIFAINMAQISEWFDYVGQEVMNALMQLAILFFLSFLTALHPKNRWVSIFMLITVSLALTREGSEIFIYIGGVIGQAPYIQSTQIQPTLTGAGIGAGIGVSAGVLIYYGLLGLPSRYIVASSVLLLALVGGNMASQATLLLTQADWLSYSQILWNSSALLPENSIFGHLLYALVGYEATPSLFQVISYVCGMLFVYLCSLFRTPKIAPPTENKATASRVNINS